MKPETLSNHYLKYTSYTVIFISRVNQSSRKSSTSQYQYLLNVQCELFGGAFWPPMLNSAFPFIFNFSRTTLSLSPFPRETCAFSVTVLSFLSFPLHFPRQVNCTCSKLFITIDFLVAQDLPKWSLLYTHIGVTKLGKNNFQQNCTIKTHEPAVQNVLIVIINICCLC